MAKSLCDDCENCNKETGYCLKRQCYRYADFAVRICQYYIKEKNGKKE
jgi:hypothetical protein